MKALITGASRGIGAAIAWALAREGYDLYLTCDRTFDILKKIAGEISSECGVNVTPFSVDMSDENAVNEMFAELDTLDVLVNNAGIAYIGLITDMSYEDWRRVMGVNLDSIFLTSRCALKGMLHNHAGKIINISSVWGEVGASMEVAYSASKGGVNLFTKALAKEVAPSNIQVNAISCGVIDTAMNSCFDEDEMNALIDEIPANRLGKADEVAKLVVSLVNAPEYLTGQVITIDGGFT